MSLRIKYFCSVAVCLCLVACSSGKKVEDSLVQPDVADVEDVAVVSSVESAEALDSFPLKTELTLDMYAYPKAIATQEDIATGAADPLVKRNAYLTLAFLHMNRVNPNQDFFAAAEALNRATEIDPTLLNDLTIQRWLDVFTLLNKMQAAHEATSQLEESNEMLRSEVEKKAYQINYLETTIEELKKIEIDVERKKRLYK